MHGGAAVAVAEARAALGYLADQASTADAMSAYEGVLLALDSYTADAAPSASNEVVLDDLRSAVALARRSLLLLAGMDVDYLQVQLLLAMLDDAVAGDVG